MLKRAQAARLLALDRPPRGTRLLILDRKDAVVGSAGACALQISDASVARRHAVIHRRRGRYLVFDLEAAGGTFVNDQRVRHRKFLKHRDSIRFGVGSVYRFIDPDASLRRSHRRLAGAMLLLMVCAGAATAHFMKWDRGLPSLATIEDSVAGEQALATPDHVPPPASTRAVAPGRVAFAARTSAGFPSPAAAASVSRTASPASPAIESAAAMRWIARLNHYRSITALAPLREDRRLTASVAAHAHYMLLNYDAEIRAGHPLGAATHSEDPAKSGYTAAGSAVAENSQFAWGCGSLDANAQIDDWIAGPFHRIEMLDPFISEAGFGEASSAGCWVAAMRLPPPPEQVQPYPHVIEFPPDGSTVSLDWRGLETPNPLTSCRGYEFPAGLPITLALGRLQVTNLSASSLTAAGQPLAHCAFDSHSYLNPDPNAQEYGRWTLRQAGAVVLIPRQPLTSGAQYSVSITAHGHTYSWKFRIGG
jgi:FHA domain/Cysteine-rich secretory protein family